MNETVAGMDDFELADVVEFLRGSLPFNELDDPTLAKVARQLRTAYCPHGTRFDVNAEQDGLRILKSGAVDIRDADNKLLDRLGEGESFHIVGLNAERGEVMATVIEDALIYRLPDEHYQNLRGEHRTVDRYFSGQRNRRLRRAARYNPAPNAMLAPIATVMNADVFTLPPDTAIHDAAAAMAERRISSVLVTEQERLLGILTDRDLRTRVLARQMDTHTPIREVMTQDPHTVSGADSIFQTTLAMTQRGYHHLPVVDDGTLRGMVTTSDLILARQDDPVYLVQHISRQSDARGIADLLSGMSNLMVRWVESGMPAQQISQILTAISDAAAVRLIQLAEEELGPAPVPWAWMGFGSQARAEQLLGADQDNGIVIDDRVEPDQLDWYRQLAVRVSDGLAACGYKYCPGKVMATTDSWRVPLADWQTTVSRWTQSPTEDAVMRVSIFYDLRVLHGDHQLVDALQQRMLATAGPNTIFLAALAANVLDNPPPLGIFRRFVVDRDGEHRDSVDIKKRGILPITEIARLHALAHGITEVNTLARLEALAKAGHMTIIDSRNLCDALTFIQQVRVQHQSEQVLAGEAPDNFVNPKILPRLAREQLRDAFTIIDEAQSSVRSTYRAGLG